MSVGLTTALVIGGVAAAGGSIASGAIGAHAAHSAADQQSEAADKAAAREAPWEQAGATSLGKIMAGFDNGTFGPGSIPAFKAPTAEEAMATPGYAFTRNEGLRAVNAAASAGGRSLGGATIKAGAQYATGLADSTYNDTFSRQLQSYQAQLAGQNQSFNQLFGVSNQGQNAATNVANLMTQSGNAQAAGTVGAANAWSGAIGGATNAISQPLLANAILNNGGKPAPPTTSVFSGIPPLSYGVG